MPEPRQHVEERNETMTPLDIELLAAAGTDSFGLERAMAENEAREKAAMRAAEDAAEAEAIARLHAWCNDPRCPEHAYTPTHPRRECPEPELSVPAYWSEPRPDFCPDCGQWARDTRTGTCAFCAVYTTTPLPPAVPYTPTPTTREGHEGRYGWGRRRRARMDRRGVR